jgi:Holliday junction DNA helicase RuvA
MIARLEGTIRLSAEDGAVILDIGGVGFEVYVPTGKTFTPGEQAVFYTHLHVRESELTLYGFATPEEKALFELLLGVSGVGPKAALSLLSTLSVDTLQQAILERQYPVLSRAPGVGRKTAEAIVLHLKDKLAKIAGPAPTVTEDNADVIAALTALGFSIMEAQRAVQKLPAGQSLSVEEKIRRALALLGQ